MRRPLLGLLLAVPLLVLAPAASSAAPVWSKSGAYLAGTPIGESAMNACTAPAGATQGVDSSCHALPAGLGGLPYTLSGTATVGAPVLKICFYASTQLLACNPAGLVPLNANRFSVASGNGVQVSWTLAVY